MIKPAHEKVSIIAAYDATTGLATPHKMRWRGHVYVITCIASHNPIWHGRLLTHLFNAYAGRSALTTPIP